MNLSLGRTIRGRRLHIPVVEDFGWENTRESAERLDGFLAHLLKRLEGTFIDVGANIGQTLMKVITIDPGRRYVGFEVSPFCVNYLDKLISANTLSECVVMPFGLSDRLHATEFGSSGPADTRGTAVKNFWSDEAQRVSRTVLLLPGDMVLPELLQEAIALLKIDVEGGELEVLKGLDVTLERHRPPILIEVLPYTQEAGDASGPALASPPTASAEPRNSPPSCGPSHTWRSG